jgi:RNA polymerase sigma factor for flagellar operon FliA
VESVGQIVNLSYKVIVIDSLGELLMPDEDYLNLDDFLQLLERIANIRYRILLNAGVKHIPAEELNNVGYFGLVQAHEKFDPKAGTKKENPSKQEIHKAFASYATYSINNAISEFLRKEDFVDHRTRLKIKEKRKVIEKLQQKFGREPTEEEIAGEMNMAIESYRKLTAKDILIESIDDPDFIYQFADEYDYEESEGSEDFKKLGKETDHCLKIALNKDEMLIVLLKEFRYFTLQDIVNVMGAGYNISKVHRINEQAKSKLKFCLEQKGWTIIDVMAIYSHN